jgi:hypothetical protein
VPEEIKMKQPIISIDCGKKSYIDVLIDENVDTIKTEMVKSNPPLSGRGLFLGVNVNT